MVLDRCVCARNAYRSEVHEKLCATVLLVRGVCERVCKSVVCDRVVCESAVGDRVVWNRSGCNQALCRGIASVSVCFRIVREGVV